MDKYFDPAYDPALDLSLEATTDENGLVADGGWDRMLDVVREREDAKRRAKDERRREKDDKRRRKELRKEGRLARSSALSSDEEPAEAPAPQPVRATREWDLGKVKDLA